MELSRAAAVAAASAPARAAELRTRARVRTAVAELGPVTVARLAPALGLTAAAVRRHLDAMETDGVVEARTPTAAGRRRTRGRPAREYVVSSAGHRELPAGYDELALSALAFVAESGGAEAVERFAQARAATLEAKLARAVGGADDDVPARVQALAEALAAEGYAASARPVDRGTGAEGTQLCQGHCPVQLVAQRYPQLCEAEAKAFERVLGTRVQRLATLAHGDHVCTTHVSHTAPVRHAVAARAAPAAGTAGTIRSTSPASAGDSRPTTEGTRR